MAQRRASSAPPPNIAPVIVGVGFIGMLVAFYFGFPGVGVLLIALMFAGWSAVPPVFNGKKDAQGRPTPADDGEKRAMNTYRFWSDVKWRLLIPNSDWLPGLQSSRPRSSLEYLYPINYIWTIALSVGVLALGIPAHKPVELLNGSDSGEFLFRAINAFAAFSIIVVVSTSKRRNGTPDDPPPGVTIAESLKYLGTPKALPLFFSGAIISGIAAMGVLVFGDAQGLDDIISPLPLPVAAVAVFVLLYSTVLYLGTRTDALAHWRLVSAKRPEWESRWAPVLKSTDETPRLVDYEEVGFFEVSTFDASASMGYSGVLSMEAKIAPALGAGRQATILSCPDIDSQGQPMQGTINPRRFRVVTYPSDEIVDFSNPETDLKQIELGADIALMRVIVANGLGRPVFMDASPAFTIPEPEDEEEEDEPDEAEPEAEDAPKRKWWQRKPKPAEPEDESESYTAAWVCHWAIPNGPPFEYLSDYAGDIGDEAGCEVVVDKRTGDIFFGSLTVDTTPWTNPKDAERVRNILDDNTWNRRWKNVFQGKSEFIPRREANLFSKMEVNGLPIMRQPFSMGQGVELRQYDKIEDRLAIALDSAPMVAITGFKAQGDREGARHPQGMCVVWSNSAQIPSSPERLRPGSKAMANEWVLTWILNRAFDHTKRLARPEIISAKCLTAADSNGHIWEMKLRLYGGVTLEEVRSSSEKIRQSMGCQWIRVIEDTYGCTIAAGVKPSNPGVKLASARTADRISELNWEQAFAIANVSGHGGVLPKLVHRSAMEKNPKVAILDFLLPAGCEIENVKGAVGKLSPATDNAFIQVSPTEDPKIIRILASERNPLGKSYSPDWDEIEKSTGVPFSTGVDGSPVVFDPKDTAHLMLLGLSGSGKSVAVQVLLYGALRRQWHCVVINPVKGAGDYMFAEPFLDGACLELDDFFAPAAMMRTLYDEVARRMRLLGEYGVTKIDDLPEEVRPRRFFVILDEFTSLIEQEAVPARSDEIELEREREHIIARNTAKRYVAQYTGKILREARAAGFSLMLATQKLTAKSLDPVPGGADMKDIALDTLIPVPVSGKFPQGWALMGELSVGDEVFAIDGSVVKIVQMSDIFRDNVTYRVTFDDGQSVVAGEGHLWLASDWSARRHHSRRIAEGETRRDERAVKALELSRTVPVGEMWSVAEIAEALGYSRNRIYDLARSFGLTGMSQRGAELVRSERGTFYEMSEFSMFVHKSLVSLGADDGEGFPLERVVTTAEMAATLIGREDKNEKNWAVRVADAVSLPEADLPVDPYVLGAWLGDGNSGDGIFTQGSGESCTDENGLTDAAHLSAQLEAAGFRPHSLASGRYRIGTYGLKALLSGLGVIGKKGSKHIPAQYLRSSKEQRLALLQGLMDTDGTVSKSAQCIFTQTDERLARQVLELTRSLGIKSYIGKVKTSGRDGYHYTVNFTKPHLGVFRLPRKAQVIAPFVGERAPLTRRVVSIERVETVPTRCLAIDHPEHAFLVEGFVPTHNSQLSRLLLGNASYGDKMSALRQPDKAPDLGAEVPPGRGIFEPSIGVGQIIQSWYAPVRELEERLIAALPPVTEKIDISRYLQPADEEKEVVEMPDEFAVFDSLDAGFPSFGDPESDDEEIVPVGAEVAFSLDDLDALSTDDGVVANDLGGFGGFSPEDSESQGEVEGEGSEEPAADDPDDEDWDEDADDFASFENFEPEIPALDQDLPVVVEEPLGSTEPVPVEREFSGNGSVLFLDVDGCIAPSAPVRGRTEERDVPGMGIVHVDHAATARIGALDTEVVWLTDWETDLANATFAADLGGSVEGAPRTRGEEYWWKIESIIRWIDEHPDTEALVWVDDRLDSGEGVTVREQIIDILDILGIRFLGICPDSNVGLTDRDWAQIDAFLSGESEPEPESVEPDSVPVPEPERPVRQPEPTRRRQVVLDEDDPFADLAAPRVVTGRLSNTGKVEGEPA